MELVKIENLVKHYPVGKSHFTALKGITLSFEKGEFSGVVGPSGSGKTTLLNIIGALDLPSKGTIRVMEQDIEKLRHKEAARLRKKHIGFIFQTFNLFPAYNVYENVEFPLLLLGVGAIERKKRVAEMLDRLKITDKAASRPAILSGGEAQRVAVARAMVKRPDIILADEPTANLDADNSHNILKMMVELNRDLGTTFIFSTHDEKVIGYLKRKISLIDGKVAKDEKSGDYHHA